MNWRDRVKELRRIPSKELLANPKNWREHPKEQQKALSGILEEVGIAGALLARETDDGLELIDGHLRTELDGETEWPVLVLDVDEREADALLASIDPIGSMAVKSEAKLNSLIDSISADNAELAELLKNLRTADVLPPDDFDEFDENIETEKTCPKCGYQWSGGD